MKILLHNISVKIKKWEIENKMKIIIPMKYYSSCLVSTEEKSNWEP